MCNPFLNVDLAALSAAAAKSHRAEVGDPEPKGSAVQQAPPVEAAVAGTAAPPTGPEVMVVAQQTHGQCDSDVIKT